MACNNCQECNPCSPTPCVQESCACAVFLEDTCITTTEDMPYTGILKGKTLGEWILALDEYLQNKFTSIENFFKLKNVGLGAKIYKGISILGEKEIRSLTSEDNSIIITENADSIDFSATEGLIPPFEVLYPGIYDSIVIRDRDEDNYGEPGFRCIDFSKADAPPIDPDPAYEYGAKAWYSTILNGLNQRIGANAEGAIIGGGEGNSIYNGRYSGIFCGASNVISDSGGGVSSSFIGSGVGNSILVNSVWGKSAILTGNDCTVRAYHSVINGGDSNIIEATGFESFIGVGNNNIITGSNSLIGAGSYNKTSGQFSTVLNGSECEAKGTGSAVLNGGGNIADSYLEISGGAFGTTYTPISRTAFNLADRVFNIGVGTGILDRKDGISLFKNGVATLPTVTNALITAASGKAIITKEYLESIPATTYSAGTGLSLVGTTFNNTAPDQTVALTQGGATTITGTYPNFTISSVNTTYSAGTGLELTGTTFNTVNLQKVIPAGSYGLTDADNNYTIFVDNGATAMTITVGAITIPNFCVGFIQKGTADITFVGATNPIGLKSKGQGYQTFIERELSTSNFWLLGNTKA